MSFCRSSEGESDVYMVPVDDGIRCYCRKDALFTTIDDAVKHLLEHCISGDKADYKDAIGMLRQTTIEMIDGKAVYGSISPKIINIGFEPEEIDTIIAGILCLVNNCGVTTEHGDLIKKLKLYGNYNW